MKHGLRKSFSARRRRKATNDDERLSPLAHSNSHGDLDKPVKSRRFLSRPRRSSSPVDQSKGAVFEPRLDDDDDYDDDPFAPSPTTRLRPFTRLTNQLRKSFRNTLTRPRGRLESNNSSKRLILNKNDENQVAHAPLYPLLSTGLTSPLVLPNDKETIQVSKKRRKAPLAPTHINHSSSCPGEMTFDRQAATLASDNPRRATVNQSFRKRFSFLRKKPQETSSPNIVHDVVPPAVKPTLGQRFDSLRRSLRIGHRNAPPKGQRSLLSED